MDAVEDTANEMGDAEAPPAPVKKQSSRARKMKLPAIPDEKENLSNDEELPAKPTGKGKGKKADVNEEEDKMEIDEAPMKAKPAKGKSKKNAAIKEDEDEPVPVAAKAPSSKKTTTSQEQEVAEPAKAGSKKGKATKKETTKADAEEAAAEAIANDHPVAANVADNSQSVEEIEAPEPVKASSKKGKAQLQKTDAVPAPVKSQSSGRGGGKKASEPEEQGAAEQVVVPDDTEEEEMPVKKGTKAVTKRGKKADEKEAPVQKKTKKEENEDDQMDTEEVEDKPKGRPTRKAAETAKVYDSASDGEQPAAKGRGGKKGAAAAKKAAEENGDAEDDEVAPKPAKGRSAPKKGAAATKKAVEQNVDEDDVNDDEEAPEAPAKKAPAAKKAASRTTKKAAAEAKKAEDDAEDDKEEEEEAAPVPAKGRSTKKGAAAAKKADDEADADKDEEEAVKPKATGRGKGKKAAADKDEKKDDDEEDAPGPAKGRSTKKGKKADKKATAVKKEEEEEEEEEEQPVKSGKSIRRVTVKGTAAVDPYCTRKVNTAHVFEDGELIYDVMLNQTNIGNNNNKYYVIQLLEDDAGVGYSVWFRWGRVGYDGQNKLVECGSNLEKAKKEFASKFEAKTKNAWPTTFADFESYNGKYTMIEMDYGNDDDKKSNGSGAASSDVKLEQELEEEEKKCEVVSKLDARVQNLMHLICSIKQMTAAVKELSYDADKSPLGKLTPHQIKEGYSCLKKIEDFINAKSFGAEFKAANNEYYTKIPHACGFRPPELIRDTKKLKKEMELLDLLADIEFAIKTMKQELKEDDVHPVDRHYASLHCGLQPVEKDEEEYKLVSEYLATTHGDTHYIKMTPKNIYRVQREGEEDNEEIMKKIGNRQLLWHGSRLSNFFGILSQGLRIAPPEAPSTGYMFGKGVYFADMASKSGNYCYTCNNGDTGFLLLAEVALGECNKLKQANFNANKLPKGCSSTWGMGRTMPDPAKSKTIEDGIVVPCGKPINTGERSGSLLYNEFIVYDTAQIRIRYLLECEFTARM